MSAAALATALAGVRGNIAAYLAALIDVYAVLILAWIILGLFLSFGGRLPYNRFTETITNFLREVCEPYLRIFRRFIPAVGAFDFSPIVALLVLTVGGGLIVRLIEG